VWQPVCFEHLDPRSSHALDELVAESALSYTCFADDSDDLSAPGLGFFE
jgi:hypothetical protein